MSKNTRVVVAMSGGVDSSVAAVLLRQRGFEVIGMMLRLWSEPGKEGSNRCCTPESMALAKRAAAQLDIPFYVVDARDAFRAGVVEMFLDGYAQGQTPNPCLECNRKIRWTLLLEHALALGAEMMATGHYARVEADVTGKRRLLRAVDSEKDQSYVLHVLQQEQLRRALFPIGEYRKEEVRRLAEAHSLPSAKRPDSQDLCFLAGGDYRDFLSRTRPEMFTRGEVLGVDGKVLGQHAGLANYTIGQRKGLPVHAREPLYVVRKDREGNRLIVGSRAELGTRNLETGEVQWLDGEPRSAPFRAAVKTRYTSTAQPALVMPIDAGRRAKVDFDEQQRDITPGQAAVFYVDDAVIGGGIIL